MSKDGEKAKGGRPKNGKKGKSGARSKNARSKKRGVRGVLRELVAGPEFQVEAPDDRAEDVERRAAIGVGDADGAGGAVSARPRSAEDSARREGLLAHYRMLAEVATSFWYLKTKHFKKAWDDEDPETEDPRERRALGRLAKGIRALTDGGTEVQDPTNSRYPEGGERWMKPIQLSPTAGITFAYVTETVRPIVYQHGTLIQRGEVFVAVPIEDDGDEGEAGASDETTTANTKED